MSVPFLLNVLYRRRRIILGLTLLGLLAGVAYGIIVKPLYRSVAQIRPGIVAFSPEGHPLREWALEDIVHWFDNRLYWVDMKGQPEFSAAKAAPVVDAEFIPSLNFVQGGDVITLTNLSRSQSLAVTVLDRAVKSFNRQARLDSLGSTLHLTRRAGRTRIQRIQRDIERLAADKERTELKIAQQHRELTLVDLDRKNVELELKDLENQNAWRREAVTSIRGEVAASRPRLEEAEKLLGAVLQHEAETTGMSPGSGAGDPVTEVLRQTAGREQAGRVGELLLTVNQLNRRVVDGTVRADSLAAEVKASELQMDRLRGVLEIELKKKEADIRQTIRDLEIENERDLPHTRALLQNDLDSEKLKLDLISPLERVGSITVSEKPVRPRRLRAIAILTFLALAGSVVLAFAVEYLDHHRDTILRDQLS